LGNIDKVLFEIADVKCDKKIYDYLKAKYDDLMLINENLEKLFCYEGKFPIIRKEIKEYIDKENKKKLEDAEFDDEQY